MSDYGFTKHRAFQWMFIIIILMGGVFAYYHFRSYAAVTLNKISGGTVKLDTSQNSQLTNGLVGEWSFNGADMSGTTAYDRSGQGNNGTLTNGPTPAIGQVGQALSFDGTDDYVNVGKSVGASTMTVTAWVKPDFSSQYNSGRHCIIAAAAATNYFSVCYAGDYSSIQGWITRFRGGGVTDNESYGIRKTTNNGFQGNWIFVAVTLDKDVGAKIYEDGVLQGFSPGTTGIMGSNTAVVIGNNGSGAGFWKGAMDEVRVYNRVLPASEVWDLYQLGVADKASSASSQGDPLEKGLAGYWNLDDGSGTTATDASVNANNGTLTNGPTWSTGQIGGGAVFDGTDDYVSISNPPVVGWPLTMSVWFKTTDATASYRSMAALLGVNSFAILQFDLSSCGGPGKVKYIIRDNGGSVLAQKCSSTDLNDGMWHHAVGVSSSASDHRLYIDGALQGSDATALGATTFTSMRIGTKVSGDQHFPGSLDDVRVYSRALSDGDVAKLYRTTAPDDPDTGLKGYWSFNGTDVSGTTAYDRSGSGSNGTLTNSPTLAIGKIGQGVSFDGTNDYMATSLDLPASSFSLSLWVKSNNVVSADSRRGIIDTRDVLGQWVLYQNTASWRLTFVGWDSGSSPTKSVSSTTALSANQWYHIAVTYDGTTASAYVNGVFEASTSTGNAIRDTTDHIRIGEECSFANRYWNGVIDEARVYDRALSASEVTALYSMGR